MQQSTDLNAEKKTGIILTSENGSRYETIVDSEFGA
jgi:hypothetical protein